MRKVDQYHSMFNVERFADMLTDAYTPDPSPAVATKQRTGLVQSLTETVHEHVDWARKTLKREDRIVWYLRRIKATMLNDMGQGGQLLNKAEQRFLHQNSAALREPETQQLAFIAADHRELRTTFEHFFRDSDMPEVNTFEFKRQSIEELLTSLEQLEEQYNERMEELKRWTEREGTLLFEPKSLPGFAFYDLETSGSRLEGQLMGHCGNGAGISGQTVISLREHNPDNPRLVKPHVTLIMNDKEEKMTGEIKGRFNQHPDERYHEALIEFMLSEHVNGCEGGGYLPENNFSVSNSLDEERSKALLEQKPALFTINEVYEHEGMQFTDIVLDRVMMDSSLKTFVDNTFNIDVTDGRATMTFDNAQEFFETIGHEELPQWVKGIDEFEEHSPHGDGFEYSDVPEDLLSLLKQRNISLYNQIYDTLLNYAKQDDYLADEYEDTPFSDTYTPDPSDITSLMSEVDHIDGVDEIVRCFRWAYDDAYVIGRQSFCYELVNEAMNDVGEILVSRLGDSALLEKGHHEEKLSINVDWRALVKDMIEESHFADVFSGSYNMEYEDVLQNWFERAISTELKDNVDFGYAEPDVEAAYEYFDDLLRELDLEPAEPVLPTKNSPVQDESPSLSM